MGGALGGLLSAGIAHLVTSLCDKAGHSQSWLQGRYGPPFFNVALFMGVLYGGIAFALSKRRGDVALGALGPFLGIALPLAVLERVADLPWYYVVVAVFVLAVWGTVAALGWRLGRGWKGALGAVAGSFCGYLLLTGITYATPALTHWPIPLHDYLPTPAVLLDGLLTGAGIAAGALILRRNHA